MGCKAFLFWDVGGVGVFEGVLALKKIPNYAAS